MFDPVVLVKWFVYLHSITRRKPSSQLMSCTTLPLVALVACVLLCTVSRLCGSVPPQQAAEAQLYRLLRLWLLRLEELRLEERYDLQRTTFNILNAKAWGRRNHFLDKTQSDWISGPTFLQKRAICAKDWMKNVFEYWAANIQRRKEKRENGKWSALRPVTLLTCVRVHQGAQSYRERRSELL